jgi:tetratricopeptide (TPR) repeat protein
MKIKTSYIVLLLTALVLVVYYPMISAGFNSLDDVEMVNWLLNTEHFNIKNLFLPGGSGYYYRPLLGLTFIADKYLWGLLPSFMHLENILLHTINAILVFFIGIKIFKKYDINNKLLPFSAALIFALHPVNTEAVNWISGRTDVLAGCFILFSVLFLLKALESNINLLGALAAIYLFLGCLSKESSVFFFPAVLFLIFSYDRNAGFSVVQRLKKRFVLYILFTSSVVSYFLLRHFAFIKNDSGISTAAKGVLGSDAHILNTTRIFLKVMGFYIKKLFLPWPLNFGIINVSNYYVIIGIVLVAVVLYLLYRSDVIAAVYLSSISTISPAFLVAIGGMAWTRIAERYLYIASAFFAIAITYTISMLLPVMNQSHSVESQEDLKQPFRPSVNFYAAMKSRTVNGYIQASMQKIIIAVVLILFSVLTISTVRINIIWQDNLSLFEDTVAKSPDFPPAKNELAEALLQHGRTDEAFKLVQVNADTANKSNYTTAAINRAKVMAAENDLEGSRKLLMAKLETPGKKYDEIIKELIAVDEMRADQTRSASKRFEIHSEQIDLLTKLYTKTSDPFYSYRIGQIYLFMNKRNKARSYFEKAYERAPDSAYYKLPAKRLAENLKR